MSYPGSCLLLTQVTLVIGASAWALARLVAMRRSTGGYGLSDALSAGAVGGLIGLAVGSALCILRYRAAHPGGGLGGWAGGFLVFAGVALIEGAAVGAAVAFALVRFPPGPGVPPVPPSDNRDDPA